MTEPGPVFEADRVSGLVTLALSSILEAAEDLGVDLPARQIAGVGAIPYDCEQVVVFVTQLVTGAPEPSGSGARSGAPTYPNPGANVTVYTATLSMAIVRCSTTTPQGAHGSVPPAPDAYLGNLTSASQDGAVLLHAADLALIGSLGLTGAAPRTLTYGAPQGGLFASALRLTLLA